MYTPFTNRNIQHLKMERFGWLKPQYELSDDMYSYGKLYYKWVSLCRRAFAETATGTYSFKYTGFWKTTLQILNEQEEVIGEVTGGGWKRNYQLNMINGFEAVFKKTSVWRCKYAWESVKYGPLMRIESAAFSTTDDVYIEQSNTPLEMLPLLAFLGIHIIIIKRQREAAVAST